MATSGENKVAGITTQSLKAKDDLYSTNVGSSSQHLIFATQVKNRGGYIQPQKPAISKSSCAKCAVHRSGSLIDLRASSASSMPVRYQDDNGSYHHDHHPSCPNYISHTSSKSSTNKGGDINERNLRKNSRRPSQPVMPSPGEYVKAQEQQRVMQIPLSANTKQVKSKSRIPVRILKATASSPSSLIDDQVTSDSETFKTPQFTFNRIPPSTKRSTATDDNTNELLESGVYNYNNQASSWMSSYRTRAKNDSDMLTQKRTTNSIHGNATSLYTDIKNAAQGQNKNTIMQSGSINTIKVLFRPTNVTYDVRIHQNMTIQDVIIDVSRQAQMRERDACYLWFDLRELNNNDTIFQAGLYPVLDSIKGQPEVRLKYVQIMETSFHMGKHIFLASPEHIAYDQLLNIPLPSTKKHVVPNILKQVAEQISQRTSTIYQSPQQNGTVFIPLPNFSKQSIDSLPTIHLRVPLSPNQFDWNVFLDHLAADLEIDRRDLVVVGAQEGSTKYLIKLWTKFAQAKEIVKKVQQKVQLFFLPKSEQFVTEHMQSNTTKVDKIQIELENFTENKINEDSNKLSLDEIEVALRLCERPAIINENSWNFMIEKSRQIRASILQSIQSCPDEYIIDHASIIYNEQIYEKYETLSDIDKNEKILFHGTSTFNFDGIFEKNFQLNSGAKRTDKGWYGQGIYFSSSPKKALNYAKSNSKISYLICSIVRLGRTLTVMDQRYKGKPMHPNYDSHYVPIRLDGDPVSLGETPAFDEFVVKRSEQIMPLYVVGVLKVARFIIWRDANITNEANSSLFEEIKYRYAFNIYGTQTSVEALDILKLKLIDRSMKCVVVTNGADDGEGFVRQCRSIQSSIPIAVYCKNKAYHEQWATTLPAPKINVTTSPEEVFNYITNTLQK